MAGNSSSNMRDRMREQAEKAVSGGSSYIKIPDGRKVKWFQPKDKDNGYAVDFLPYEVTVDNHPKGMKPGDLWAQKSFDVHYNVGAEEKAYVCLKSVGAGKCPICEMRADMANDPNLTKAEEKLLEDMKPKMRTLYQLIDLDDEKSGIQLWDYSYHLFEKRLLSEVNKTEHAATGSGRGRKGTVHGGFAELEGGQTLILSFIQKTMGQNKFFECDRIDAEERQDYGDEILDETLDLDSILEVLPYDQLKKIALAIDDKDAKSGDSEDGGKGRGRGRQKEEPEPENTGRRGRGRQEPEPEEPNEEPPARSRGGRGRQEPEPEPENTGRRGRGKTAEPEPEQTSGRRGRGRTTEPEPEPEQTTGRRGRGRAAEPEPEPEPERPSRPNRPARGGNNDDPECPAGGVFGKDCQTHDACYDCPDGTWKACQDRQLEMKAQGGRGR